MGTPEVHVEIRTSPWFQGRGDGLVHEHRETVIVRGVTYSRYKQKCGEPAPQPTDHFRASGGEFPGVLCGKCFRSEFELIYGDYEIRARCTRCGHEDSVYDG